MVLRSNHSIISRKVTSEGVFFVLVTKRNDGKQIHVRTHFSWLCLCAYHPGNIFARPFGVIKEVIGKSEITATT